MIKLKELCEQTVRRNQVEMKLRKALSNPARNILFLLSTVPMNRGVGVPRSLGFRSHGIRNPPENVFLCIFECAII
jgi:hypothetical protein